MKANFSTPQSLTTTLLISSSHHLISDLSETVVLSHLNCKSCWRFLCKIFYHSSTESSTLWFNGASLSFWVRMLGWGKPSSGTFWPLLFVKNYRRSSWSTNPSRYEDEYGPSSDGCVRLSTIKILLPFEWTAGGERSGQPSTQSSQSIFPFS
jgi:hypothetical protein